MKMSVMGKDQEKQLDLEEQDTFDTIQLISHESYNVLGVRGVARISTSHNRKHDQDREF